MAKIFWTESALDDLKDIIEYISKDSVNYARRIGEKIIKSTQLLKDFMEMGRIVPEFNKEDIREIIYSTYRIIYKIDKDFGKCYIVSVLHSSRDLIQHYKPDKWDIP